MNDNGTLSDLQNKILRRAVNIQKLTEVEQFDLDKEWTEYLKDLVDYGNKHLLKSFQYSLAMEEV